MTEHATDAREYHEALADRHGYVWINGHAYDEAEVPDEEDLG